MYKYFLTFILIIFLQQNTQAQLTVNIIETSPISCTDSTDAVLTVFANGGIGPLTYVWNTLDMTSTISNLGPGVYNVAVSDSLGQFGVDTFEVIEPLPLNTVTDSTELSNCNPFSGAATTSPTGGTVPYFYQWSNNGNSQTINQLEAGTYFVTITDVRGCTLVDGTDIPPKGGPPVLSVEYGHVQCFNNNDGFIDLTVTGGTEPFTFQWTPSSTQEDINGLAAGPYTVLVTDAENCLASTSVIIEQPAELEVIPFTTASEIGGATGSATVNVSGGVPAYTFFWDNGDTTQSINNLPPGDYNVTVTDQNGCSEVETVEVGEFVSTENLSGLTHFKMGPNPVNNILNVELYFTQQKELNILIINSLGQVCHFETTQGNQVNKSLSLDFLPVGFYYIRISDGMEGMVRAFVVGR